MSIDVPVYAADAETVASWALSHVASDIAYARPSPAPL